MTNKKYTKNKFTAYDFSIKDIRDNKIDTEFLDEIKDKTCVYIQYTSNLMKFYVGQSDRYFSKSSTNRFNEHFREHADKSGNIIHNKFERVLIIISKYLQGNGDILETKVLKYMDTEYLINTKKNLVNHRLNQTHSEEKSPIIENELFPELWTLLREMNFVKSELENIIKNPIKYYSPFGKTLDDIQSTTINKIVDLSNKNNKNLFIQGEPGTGKTFITANAVFELINLEKKVAIIVNQPSMVKIYTDLFKLVSKSRKPFVGSLATFKNGLEKNIFLLDEYSIIIVDEAHRLKQPQGLHNNLPNTYILDRNNMDFTELDIIEGYEKPLVLMFDEFQLTRDSDIDLKKFKKRVNESANYEKITLETQYRIQSSSQISANDYTKGIRNLLKLEESKFDNEVFTNGYKFKIVDSLEELVDEVKTKINASHHNTRILSGFYKDWTSKNHGENFEWTSIEYDLDLRWNTPNSKLGKKNWLKYTQENDLEFTEVGSIHVAQGMDLDYAAIIIGDDLDISIVDDKIRLFANSDYYFDSKGKPIKGTDDGSRLTEYVKKIYYILLTRGIHGTFVYIENPKLKKYFKEFIYNKKTI